MGTEETTGSASQSVRSPVGRISTEAGKLKYSTRCLCVGIQTATSLSVMDLSDIELES